MKQCWKSDWTTCVTQRRTNPTESALCVKLEWFSSFCRVFGLCWFSRMAGVTTSSLSSVLLLHQQKMLFCCVKSELRKIRKHFFVTFQERTRTRSGSEGQASFPRTAASVTTGNRSGWVTSSWRCSTSRRSRPTSPSQRTDAGSAWRTASGAGRLATRRGRSSLTCSPRTAGELGFIQLSAVFDSASLSTECTDPSRKWFVLSAQCAESNTNDFR